MSAFWVVSFSSPSRCSTPPWFSSACCHSHGPIYLLVTRSPRSASSLTSRNCRMSCTPLAVNACPLPCPLGYKRARWILRTARHPSPRLGSHQPIFPMFSSSSASFPPSPRSAHDFLSLCFTRAPRCSGCTLHTLAVCNPASLSKRSTPAYSRSSCSPAQPLLPLSCSSSPR